MKQVDPAEATLAVIGVRPILTREVERFTMEQARNVADYPKTIYKLAKSVVQGERFKVPFEPINYRKTLEALFSDEFNMQQIADMAAKFPPILHAVTSDFLVEAGNMIQYLRKLYPRNDRQTLTGAVQALQPSALAIQRFVTTFNILDDPLRTFAFIASGSLLHTQVQCMRDMYPTISDAITDAFDDAETGERAKKKSFQLPPLTQIGLATWKNLPRLDPALQSRLQQNFAEARKTQQGQPKPQTEGTSQSVIAKESLTNTQRALFPQTSKAGG